MKIVAREGVGGGGAVLPHMGYVGMCRWEGYVFQSESLGLEKGIIFHLN